MTRLQRRVRRSTRHRLSSPSSSVLSNPGSASPTTATTVSADMKTGENDRERHRAGAAIVAVEPSAGDQIRRLEPSDQASFPSGDHAGWLASPGWGRRMTRSGVWMTTASGPASSSTYAVPEPAFAATWRTTPAPPLGRERPPAPVRVEHDERPAADHSRETVAARSDRVRARAVDIFSDAHAAARGAWPNAVPETMPMMLAVSADRERDRSLTHAASVQ